MKLFSSAELRSVWGSLKIDAFTTRILVDPIAVPLVVLCSKNKSVTPNRITLLAFGAGAISAWMFYSGSFIYGATWYYIFWLLDSIDGKLARLTRNFHPHGAFFDFVVDRTIVSAMSFGITTVFVRDGMLTEAALMGVFVLVFLMKDVLDLKLREVSARDGKWQASQADDGDSVWVLAKYRVHFKPGQIMSCFLAFLVAPLSSKYEPVLSIAIVLVLISILSNIILPFFSSSRRETA